MKKTKDLKEFLNELQEFVDSKPDWFKQMAEYYSADYKPETPKLKVVKND